MRLPGAQFCTLSVFRRLLPMPSAYILVAEPHPCDMAIRLMERESYQRYHKMACRLRYCESGIRRHFRSVLRLMAWAPKPMNALTYDLKSAYQILEAKDEVNIQRTDFLAWYNQLLGIRNVLYHLWTLAGLKPAFMNSLRRDYPSTYTVAVGTHLVLYSAHLRHSLTC